MGCVYKISKGEFVYYGSTCNFKQRMIQHKCDCNNKKGRHYNFKLYKTIRDNGGWDAFTKCIVEDNIETEKQWKERETYYLRQFECNMNTRHHKTEEEYKASQKESSKAYKVKNKESINIYMKEYREKNKEKIKAQKSKRIICECGRTIRQGGKAAHERTPTHIKLMVAKLMEEYISQII